MPSNQGTTPFGEAGVPSLSASVQAGGAVVLNAAWNWSMLRMGNVVVAVWRHKWGCDEAKACLEDMARVAESAPGHCAYLAIVEPGCPPPDSTTRNFIQASLARIGKKLPYFVTVIEGSPVRVAFVRLVQVGVTMFGGSQQEVCFFHKVDAAENWLKDRLPHLATLSIKSEVDKMRTSMPRSAP
jgi:hypothetical protein